MMDLEALKYPMGRFKAPETIDTEQRKIWIETIENFPIQLEAFAKQLTEKQLETPYRPEGWTARQVIHHLYDSHTHCYVRMKAALTEGENPEIKDYNENAYANLSDGKSGPIEFSILGLKALHSRWTYWMKTFTEEDWEKSYFHPTRQITYKLDKVLGIYAWHCLHHLEHLKIIVNG
ncbi:putative metal-dependent hydrolase [Sandaracinomonas limnophila]|uniref:Putative metal-dependent hydrolase n=2 Tax=Sandaracinomonas limnophila TaxID=1862386 RepID=A0A437PTV5_9BACT|nr:putative metal-dependent hydrolase [Sandaracinomonas limnophila]